MRASDLFGVTPKQRIMEGGNIFKGRTASIRQEDIEPTLNHYFAELKSVFPKKANLFDLRNFKLLGSAGKKPVSGDIDLGVDASKLLDAPMSDASIAEWGIDPKAVQADADDMARRARTATPTMLRMKAFLRALARKINQSAPLLHTEESKVSHGNLFGMYPQFNNQNKKLGTAVQIDWMVGDLEWLTFSYYSAAYPADSNVKGLHRTQLMLAAFQLADLSFDHVNGVKDKATGQVLAKRPTDALALLSQRLGLKITQDVAEDYFKLHAVLKSLPNAQYNRLLDIYLKILDSTRCDIPQDMQQYWKDNQQRLGLKGKFLPDTSALKPLATQ